MPDTTYDLVSAIVRYEEGEMTDAEVLDLYQYLVDTGLAWQLQGSYGRMAARLIADGLVTAPGAPVPAWQLAADPFEGIPNAHDEDARPLA